MDLPPVVAELKATITEFKSKMSEAKGEMHSVEKEGGGAFSKLGGVAAGALAGAGAVAVGFAASSVKAALESGKADALLEQAITNVGGSMEEMHPKIDATVDKMAKFGFTDVQVDDALAKLTTATGDPAKALENMGLVADFARAKHVDLTTAAQTVGKVMNGNVGALSRLGISTKDAAGHTLTAAAAMAMLNQRFGGAAQAEAGTYAGKMEAFKAQMENFQVKVGQALIPVLVKLMSILMLVVQWFEKHRLAAVVLGLVIASILVPAIISMVAGWVAAAAAMIVAMAPIIAIIAALTAVVAAVVLVWTNWDTIWTWIMDHKAYAAIIALLALPITMFVLIIGGLKTLWENWDSIWSTIQDKTSSTVAVVLAIWQAMSDAVTAGIEFVRATIEAVMNVISALWSGDWATIGGYLAAAWEGIKGAVSAGIAAVVQFFSDLPGQVVTAIGDIGGVIAGVFTGAVGAVTGAVAGLVSSAVAEVAKLPGEAVAALADLGGSLISGIGSAFKGAWNSVIGSLPSLDITMPLDIPNIHIDFDFLKLATGGVVPGGEGSPVPAIVHGGELVLNRRQQNRLADMLLGRGPMPGTAAAQTAGGDTHVSIHGVFGTIREAGAVVADELGWQQRIR